MYAIIPAAGQGLRFQGATPGPGARKQFRLLQSKPVLLHTLEVLSQSPLLKGIIVVVPASDIDFTRKLVGSVAKNLKIVVGGESRQDSVANGFSAIPPCEIVVVHDGVRPLVSEGLIAKTIAAAQKYGAAITALPVKETIKEVDQGRVIRTVDRSALWSVQTPQAFRYGLLARALQKAKQENFYGTDESMLVERLGEPVQVVEGEAYNIKITTPDDLAMAAIFLEQSK